MLSNFTRPLVHVFLIFYYIVESIVVKFIPARFLYKKDVNGQVVLITGAGGGIGRLLAIGLAKLGATIICWDVAKQANEETVRLIKQNDGAAFGYHIDLTKKSEIYRVASLVKTEIGKVDILINNAGIVTGKSILACSDEQIARTFDVNVMAQFWTIKSFLPEMLQKNKGHIVNIASLAGLNGINRLVDYCSSKFAVVGLSESLDMELKVENHTGVKTTVICPFFVATPLFAGIKSKFVPVLTAEKVVEDTINAILTEQAFCIVPSYLILIQFVKNTVSTKAFEQMAYLFGMDQTMNDFEGPKTKYL